jgi:hypothetical protein
LPLLTVWAFPRPNGRWPDLAGTTPSADFRRTVSNPCELFSSGTSRTCGRISRGKFDRFRRTTAGFTRHALDGTGLRLVLQTRPALAPRIRFLFISPRLCLPLLSDDPSQRRPWGSAILHLHQVGPGLPPGTVEHARHTKGTPSRVGDGVFHFGLWVVAFSITGRRPAVNRLLP